MATGEFKYRIKAEDQSRQGIESAKRNMNSLGENANRTGGILKAAFGAAVVAAIVKVGQKVAQVTQELVQAYGVQEQAEAKLAAAIRNNPMLDAGSQRRLEAWAASLQQVSTVGDEVSISQAGMLAAMGRNEQQIQDIIETAADLSAGLGIDLNTAIRGVNNAMDGNVTTLSRYVPSLRDLTEEQRASGEAMEVLNQQFDGMAQQMAGTTLGHMEQLKNSWGDLKEIIGEGLAPLFGDVLEFLAGVVQRAAEFVQNMRALKEARDALDEGEDLTLHHELALAMDAAQETRQQLNMSRTTSGGVWEEQRLAQVAHLEALLQAQENMVAAIERAIAAQASQAEFRESLVAPQGIPGVVDAVADGVEEAFEKVIKRNGELVKDLKSSDTVVDGALGGPGKYIGLELDGFADALRFAQDAVMEFDEAVTEVEHQINRGTQSGVTGSLDGYGAGYGGYGRPGEWGDFSSFNQGSIDTFVSALSSAAPQLVTLSSAASVLSLVFQGMFDVIGDAVNSGFATVIGWIIQLGRIIGTILAPWFEVLSGALEILAGAFIWFYNKVLRHIGNVLVALFKGVQTVIWGFVQGIVKVTNAIIDMVNLLRRESKEFAHVTNPIDKPSWEDGWLDEISLEDLITTGLTGPGVTTTGTPAQYTTGRTINVSVVVNTDALVGEDGLSQFAVMIRDEIRAAEALGY